MKINQAQHSALLAGLRLLQQALESGTVTPDDGDLGDILTCGGEHAPMTVEEIEAFIETTFNVAGLTSDVAGAHE
ncbi:hypothetical protein GFK26_18345 [Variovorax paradoxus]|uniref:Uncharacterized protein n=1 Tax=Variovorax paradoxus TaxID=34073 RepID=A0A5Q0M528_VARPD|nr:hypothetical protein [Variovorax paradoxus]QFZ84589.1 hypothetical protein GFK26_18345 [Variovorax paradoxus]